MALVTELWHNLHVQGNNIFNSFFIFVVYGSPDRVKRKSLWTGLMEVLPPDPAPWMILGDSNVVLSPKDKKSDCSTGKRCNLFGNFVDYCNLQDLGFIGPSFTWQRGNTHERIDRALANDPWISTFSYTLVYHLPHIKSDHRPILIKTNPALNFPKGRPFCFLSGWTKHANFKDLVFEKWWYSGNMATSLSEFTSHVKDWNKSVYGFIGSRKKQLMQLLGCIQKAMDWSSSSRLAEKEMEICGELETVLNHEELLWRQKARYDWLQFGDRNTQYFHSCTIQRRKSNRILALRISSGEWCSDQSILSAKAVRFFEKLYGEIPTPMSAAPLNIFPRISDQNFDFLNKPILNDEIKKALFDMAPLKAPGSDGYHAFFFQSQWDLVGGAVCEWIQGVFAGNKMENDLTNTLIVLIPKKDRPENFSEFQPISLCSVLYKLVMKVITNRFKVVFPNYITPEQAGFISGRNISDNIIIARKAGNKWMAIKLHLEKAYDRISWELINVSLVAAGIPEVLRKNGVSSQSFKPVRGIRQGCPLSPYLFVLYMEWLGHLIRSEITAKRWKLIRLSRALFGAPILHDRVTKSTLNFVVEKVRGKLHNWEARKLSFAGRVTLAQSVLLAIPSFFMQSLLVPKGVCEEIEKIVRQFSSGGSNEQHKIAMVGWESICQPRSRGGLGFRHLQDQNFSFLMKIGFNLISEKDALWVRVLRSKYGWKSEFPDSIQRSNCSHLWRSLSKVWPLFCENFLWSVGDGSIIRGWKDSWIPDAGSLSSYVENHSRLDLESPLRDWVLPNSSWNVDLLSVWLPEAIIKRIKSVWKYKGPQRVRLFLWLAAKQRLLTNSERVRRGFGQSSLCSLCGHDSEDLLHVLRDCLIAKETWMLVVPTEKISRGVVRDQEGNWILGYTHYLGRFSPLETELWGILDGILISLSKGYKKVKLQTDDIEVVRILFMEETEDFGTTLIRRIKCLLCSEGQWEIKHIPRECNLIADQLAKISLSWQVPLQVFEAPPDLVATVIQKDQAFRAS
ncbi:hypothetical protein CXB51_035140 [Gossypium anomalum]|uniref:Reverse transcriptase domain-containing protein n=1 Tax=Gossypium anomalum TaxID=47600 RepID=A0A8J6CFI5_9ROSI|nr:hypothetical protein CXB51_035140 [Gossypium anomalum]